MLLFLPLLLLQQLELLSNLLDVLGPSLDSIIGLLNTIRALHPVQIKTVNGQTTVYTNHPQAPSFLPVINFPRFNFGRRLFHWGR